MSYSKLNYHKLSPDPIDPTGQAKVYHCCLCGKKLSSFSSLDRHILIHFGKRPFLCEVCGQTFTRNEDMHRHLRGHTGQKPFECKICNLGYTRKDYLLKHVKNMHKKNSKENARDHIIIHEGDDGSNSFAKPSRDSFLLARHDTLYENDVMTGAPTIFPPTPTSLLAFIPFKPFDVEYKEIEKIKSEESDEAPLNLSKHAIDTLVNEKMKATNEQDLKTHSKYNNNLTYLESMSRKTDIMPSFPIARFPFTFPFLHGSPDAPFGPPNLVLNAINPATFPFNPMHLAAIIAAKSAAALHSLNHMQDLAAQRGFKLLTFRN